MEIKDSIKNSIIKTKDWLEDQVWFQEVKTKWDEIDPERRFYIKLASLVASVCCFIFLTFSFWWNVHSLKSEVNEKSDLLTLMRSASDEVARFKESGQLDTGDISQWPSVFQTFASSSGIKEDQMTVSSGQEISKTDQLTETHFELSLKQVNLKQVIKLAFQIENGGKPVKLQQLTIDTKNTMDGYLEASLGVSAFNFQAKQE